MLLIRTLLILLLVAAGVSFACFALTGQPRFKRFGVNILKWTILAALVFFGVLIVQNLAGA
ncbi:MAG: hypothetical protein IAE92_06085 [Burkholderiaceae bacterium]|nr:hypothetical protein [Burkholderiaceae bacterium]